MKERGARTRPGPAVVPQGLFCPAAMVGFFEALSHAAENGQATPDLLDRIAEEHDMEVLGPVPDSYL